MCLILSPFCWFLIISMCVSFPLIYSCWYLFLSFLVSSIILSDHSYFFLSLFQSCVLVLFLWLPSMISFCGLLISIIVIVDFPFLVAFDVSSPLFESLVSDVFFGVVYNVLSSIQIYVRLIPMSPMSSSIWYAIWSPMCSHLFIYV